MKKQIVRNILPGVQVRFTTSKPIGLLLIAGCFVASLLDISTAAGQTDSAVPEWLKQTRVLRTSNRRDNGDMIAVVRPLTSKISDSVVQIVSDNKTVSLGVIVTSDGYLLTKRSELTVDPLRVRLADGRLQPASVAAVRRKSDLALLRIEGIQTSFDPVVFADLTPAVGSFLISAGRGGDPLGIGVVSVAARKVDHNGRLGIQFHELETQATVRGVWHDSGADDAGVMPGDRIVAVNGRSETNRVPIVQMLRDMFPGESVRLTIVRGGTTLDLDAKIRDFGIIQESENDSKVNGPRSTRLSGFEQVIQHDTVLSPNECGGPIVDTQGRAIGLNIARAGRVVSYALPASIVISDMVSMLNEARGNGTGR